MKILCDKQMHCLKSTRKARKVYDVLHNYWKGPSRRESYVKPGAARQYNKHAATSPKHLRKARLKGH